MDNAPRFTTFFLFSVLTEVKAAFFFSEKLPHRLDLRMYYELINLITRLAIRVTKKQKDGQVPIMKRYCSSITYLALPEKLYVHLRFDI